MYSKIQKIYTSICEPSVGTCEVQNYGNINNFCARSLDSSNTLSSSLYDAPELRPPYDLLYLSLQRREPNQLCSKYLHDYIKCIYQDESCCVNLYEKYKKCTNARDLHQN